MFGSYTESIKIVEEMKGHYQKYGWETDTLDNVICKLLIAEHNEIATYEELMLAGSPGGFEGTQEDYNKILMKHY